MPHYEFDIDEFFRSDGAPADVATQRQDGFFRLAGVYQDRYPKGRQMTAEAATRISDLQFTEAYRVPFQYSRLVREHLATSAFVQSSSGVTVTDVDGNVSYDLTGSYGVNIFGNDFYKECITKPKSARTRSDRCSAPIIPSSPTTSKRLCEISGLDEVSFHMSGTEAVMQAVRLARYHTRRSHLVRFAGAYHGWWGDVQPGVGNPVSPHETYTLADMSERTLHVLRTRHDIACVLVNPLQALHPNANAPGNSALVDSSRKGAFRSRRLHRMAEEAARGLHRTRHRADLRRSLRRLPPRRRRRPGIFRRPRRHGDVRQEPCRRTAGRRGLRPQGPDAALPRRSSRRHLLCPRHLQFASLCHDGDGRIPQPARQPELQCRLQRARRDLERARQDAERAAGRAGPCRCASAISRRSGWCNIPSRPATTGCCNIICAPKGWR